MVGPAERKPAAAPAAAPWAFALVLLIGAGVGGDLVEKIASHVLDLVLASDGVHKEGSREHPSEFDCRVLCPLGRLIRALGPHVAQNIDDLGHEDRDEVQSVPDVLETER